MTKILYLNTFTLDSSTRLIRIQKASPAYYPGEAKKSILLVVRTARVNHKGPVDLLNQNQPHQLVGHGQSGV